MIIKIMITIMIITIMITIMIITIMIMVTIMITMVMIIMITRYAPEGKPMYQIVEELAEDNEYFIEVPLVHVNHH